MKEKQINKTNDSFYVSKLFYKPGIIDIVTKSYYLFAVFNIHNREEESNPLPAALLDLYKKLILKKLITIVTRESQTKKKMFFLKILVQLNKFN